MKLVDDDVLALPGLHVNPDLGHSVSEPDLEDLLVAVGGGDGALGVSEEGDPVG